MRPAARRRQAARDELAAVVHAGRLARCGRCGANDRVNLSVVRDANKRLQLRFRCVACGQVATTAHS